MTSQQNQAVRDSQSHQAHESHKDGEENGTCRESQWQHTKESRDTSEHHRRSHGSKHLLGSGDTITLDFIVSQQDVNNEVDKQSNGHGQSNVGDRIDLHPNKIQETWSQARHGKGVRVLDRVMHDCNVVPRFLT